MTGVDRRHGSYALDYVQNITGGGLLVKVGGRGRLWPPMMQHMSIGLDCSCEVRPIDVYTCISNYFSTCILMLLMYLVVSHRVVTIGIPLPGFMRRPITA